MNATRTPHSSCPTCVNRENVRLYRKSKEPQKLSAFERVSLENDDLRDLIKAAHDKLDDLNAQFGDQGNLCLCCHAQRHHSDVGIIHRQNCLVVRLRAFKDD